jgi:hypothetical protein
MGFKVKNGTADSAVYTARRTLTLPDPYFASAHRIHRNFIHGGFKN